MTAERPVIVNQAGWIRSSTASMLESFRPRRSVEGALPARGLLLAPGQSRRLREKRGEGDHMGMEAGTMALFTLITALITALLSLVNAVGVLLVNGKVDRLAKRVEWLTGRVERLTGRVDALEGTVQSMVGAIAGGARGGSE